MAKNDDKPESPPLPASAKPLEGEGQEIVGAPRSSERQGAEQRFENPSVDEPTPAMHGLLVDSSEATKQDEELYEAYIGVDEDRKRVPARDVLRPQWGEGEKEALEEAEAQADRNTLRQGYLERQAADEVARREKEEAVKRAVEDRQSNKD